MSDVWLNIVMVVVFVLIGGIFSGAEIALVALREGQVRALSEGGRDGGKQLDGETRGIMEAQSERLYAETRAVLAWQKPLTEHLVGKLLEAGEWFGDSVWHDFTNAMSSTCFAISVYRSHTHAPLWPYCLNE